MQDKAGMGDEKAEEVCPHTHDSPGEGPSPPPLDSFADDDVGQ